MAQGCTWILGRGASAANGLPWSVPDEWKRDLAEGRTSREEHIEKITNAIRDQMSKPSVHCTPYRNLINAMATRTLEEGYHQLLTTNWDYLLQRELDEWAAVNCPGYAPPFLGTGGMVYQLNGSAEPGEFRNRSPFLLETDSAAVRRSTYEANQAFNCLLWSQLVVVVGMSFECNIDIGLLGALRAHEDNVPIGEALFVVVNRNASALEDSYEKLAACFPRAGGIRVNREFGEWIRAGMPELVGHIYRPDK